MIPLPTVRPHFIFRFLAPILALASPLLAAAASLPPAPVILDGEWRLQEVSKAPEPGAAISAPGFDASGWYKATVPGTVLTTLVNNHVYPEPLYGENNRPEIIPDTLARASYWYRTTITVPKAYKGRHVWLNFDGINYSARVWVNGSEVGTIRGAFIRGIFDITSHVRPGKSAVVAVLITPQPHPGIPHEHTIRAGMGQNGGVTAIDGPTFLSTIGWDWIPAIRDRDSGIWQKVFLSATGPVLLKDPLVTTDLPLPRTDSADISVIATLENISDKPVKGTIEGKIETITFKKKIDLAPHSTQQITFDPTTTSALRMQNPRLWWPNGYGPQNLYTLQLTVRKGRKVSDAQNITFGVRKVTYSVPGTENLTISVNGVPIFIRGGDWGLDEAMKHIPRARLEAEIHMHQLANLNMIRNWVGQSTGEDFYELCDKYGILIWDEFFQPNPADGPNPTDIPTYLANVRDKVLRFRNHPSIALWCGRNEGFPPPEINAALQKLMAELDSTRVYQPSSTDGHGVRSHGPYHWRSPRDFYTVTDDFFKTETGSVSVPTLESIQGMMPRKDWETINDDWAEHDLARGAQQGDLYPGIIAIRYGKLANLADFVRKAQLANYEALRAMYEGRNAQLFHPTTAILTWMSNPAQPSFVWQLYHYDLEPNASLFAVMHASELLHIQLNESNGQLQVINNLPHPLIGASAHVALYNLDGSIVYEHSMPVTAAADRATNLGVLELPPTLSPVFFVKLDLHDATGKPVSTNFYWHASSAHPDDLTALNNLSTATLTATADAKDADGTRVIDVTLHNPTSHVALMAHLQLRRRQSGDRVLPVYYSDNYVSLAPNESRVITIQAADADFHNEDPLIVLDGWNVSVAPATSSGVTFETNVNAQPGHWPTTGLPFATTGLR